METLARAGASAATPLFLLAAFTSSAMAQCDNTAPTTGTTVTCSGSSATPVVAAPGSTGVTINVLPGATVSGSHGSTVPFPLLSVEQSSTITNSGTLSLTGGGGSGTNRGAAMLGDANSNQLTNAAGAVISTTGAFNDGMAANGSGNTLTNNGSITTTGPNAYGMTAAWGQTNTGQSGNALINTGSVATQGSNARAASILGGSGLINNSGTLSTTGGSSSTAYMQGDNDHLINTGTISASGGDSEAVFSNTVGSSFTALIENQAGGEIISQDGPGIRSLNGSTTVVNAGLIQSNAGTAISMGNGNDSLVLQTGSSIVGTADGGAGTNTVTLQGTGTASNAFTDFQTLVMQGSLWNWAGSGTFANALVQSGTLDVTGTLGAATAASVSAGATLEAAAQNMPQPIADDGTVLFNQTTDGTYAGSISGSGMVTKIGSGVLTLSGGNSYAGGTAIDGGTVQIGSDANLGAPTGPLSLDGGTLTTTAGMTSTRATTLGAGGGTFDTATPDPQDPTQYFSFNGTVSGAGGLTKTGTGTMILGGNNSYAGPTTVSNGYLYVNGDQSAATGLTSVASGARLGGMGTVGGSVTLASGAVLQPGFQPLTPATLTINGSLTANSGSILFYNVIQANVAGGPLNDLTIVRGNLDLDGAVLNILDQGQSPLGPGVYRILDYSGTLTGAGLTLGSFTTNAMTPTAPLTGVSVQTSIPGQVNLISTAGLTLNYWDGDAGPKDDGVINGGNGVWQNSAGNNNWTNASGTPNAPFADQAFAIFTGSPGTVTVDRSHGDVFASGMQFVVDGYRLQGDPINLVGSPLDPTATVIRVGDGSSASAGMTATVDSVLAGGTTLTKTDLGTLVLTAANTYSGGTAINGGVLQVASDGNLGAAAGALGLDGGTLRTTADMTTARATTLGASGGTFETMAATTLTHAGVITGAGALTKSGAGTLALTAGNDYSGGTTIAAGTLQLGDGGASGSIVGGVADAGTLAFNRSDTVTFAGAISGSGAVNQIGSGTTILVGANSYSGATTVAAGTLQAGAAGVFSAASDHVVLPGATLSLDGFDQTVRSLSNGGTVTTGSPPGTTLTVAGNYTGSGGVLAMHTTLNGDSSPTDRLVVEGSTAGTTTVVVSNSGGTGAPTTNGIKIIDVAGASNGIFTLQGDYLFHGAPAVVAGAYAYTLNKNGITTPNDGDWYLRSSLIAGDSASPPLYQPGVPVYESYPQVLLALNRLPTLRQRVGDRYADGSLVAPSEGAASPGVPSQGPLWARVEGSHDHLTPRTSTSMADYDIDSWQLQAGLDGEIRRAGDGRLFGGLTARYGTATADVSSVYGPGKIDVAGYGLGATLTWYGDNNVYVDAQSQFTWFDSDLSSDLTRRDLAKGNDGFGYALGLETGRKIALAPRWSVTPQVQLTYSAADFDSFRDTFGAQVASDHGDSLLGRLGLAADYEESWRDESGKLVSAKLYGITNLSYEFLSGTRVTVSGASFTSTNDQQWGGLGLGGQYGWGGGKYALYGEAAVDTSLANFGDSYAVKGTVGFRMSL